MGDSSLGLPDKNALRMCGAILLPGGLIAFSWVILSDSILGTSLLTSILEIERALPALALVAFILLSGVIWSALCNRLESGILDPITNKRFVAAVTGRATAQECPTDDDLYDDEWEYYRVHIERFKNRHMSGLVTSFFWEWNVGWSLICASVCTLLIQPAPIFGRIDPYSSVHRHPCAIAIPIISLAIGLLMTWILAPWTHEALAHIRHGMMMADSGWLTTRKDSTGPASTIESGGDPENPLGSSPSGPDEHQ